MSDFSSEGYMNMELLRFTTAGSVDDGKSTLIGRLLYDSKQIFEDQLEAIEQRSQQRGFEHVDLSLLTDGLKAEREQGITIDVAYRYFATPKRKFIIADTPFDTFSMESNIEFSFISFLFLYKYVSSVSMKLTSL